VGRRTCRTVHGTGRPGPTNWLVSCGDGKQAGGAVADRAEPRILIRRRNWNANHGRLRGWIAVAVAALAIVVVVVLVAWPR
jgi:hypothetical protein